MGTDDRASVSGNRAIAGAALAYAVCACMVLAGLPRHPAIPTSFADWVAVPAQLAALAVSSRTLHQRGRANPYPRASWSLITAFCAMGLLATFLWNEWRVPGNDSLLSIPVIVYLSDFALLTAFYGVAFRRFGGQFLSVRTGLDALTVLVALLGTFWAVLLGPFTPVGQSHALGLAFAGTDALSISTMITLALLLYLRLPRNQLRAAELLLIGAGIAMFLGELAWLATSLRNEDLMGNFYNFGDLVCFTMITCAAAIPVPAFADRTELGIERNSDSFTPVLCALLGTALIAISVATTRAADAWVMGALVLLIIILLGMRQVALRRELGEMNRTIALRAADARLTELVRESADAFLVLDAEARVIFASAAIEPMLGITPQRLRGRCGPLLLGSQHEPLLGEFLSRLLTQPVARDSIEITIGSDGAPSRVLRIVGSNHLTNPQIAGLALTLSDVTALRQLEREVLEVANQERMRLAGDIHEGLGQQLTGITLMLQGVAQAPDPDPRNQQAHLQEIISELDLAIRDARELARGLSPMYVVGGSLRGALQWLGNDGRTAPRVRVVVGPNFDDSTMDNFAADHVFRIAQEAVQNAARHGRCTQVDVALEQRDEVLFLTVADDGCGLHARPGTQPGLGLRLMEYRARVIGGSFAIGSPPGRGTLVRLCLPLRRTLAERHAV